MTLDERIKKDLEELYNNGSLSGKIVNAEALQCMIKDGAKDSFFSTKGLPGYFTGDRLAQTVFVTLNPGQDADKSNNTICEDINTFGIKTENIARFISSYISARKELGNIIKGSSFDVKQARFLQAWTNCGVKFPLDFPLNRKSYPQAKKNVLLDKLQLELVPYCSKKFQINYNRCKILLPYLDTIFSEIFSVERKYVIFAGKIFESLFELYKSEANAYCDIAFLSRSNNQILFSKSSNSINTHCCIYKITRKEDGEMLKVLIASSFQHQRLVGSIINDYGKFCFEEYNKV